MAWHKNNSEESLSGAMENDTFYCDICLHNFNNTYAVLLITYFLTVVPANGWTLWLMISSSNFLTDKMDLLKFSLLINDLVLGLVILVMVPGIYLFHQVTQYLWGFFTGSVMVGRPLLQSSISLERYLAVLHPHTFLRYRPLRYRATILALAYLVVTVCCCLRISLCVTMNKHIIFITRFYATELLFFFLINSFCCLSVLWVLYQPCAGARRERNPVKKKAFNTVIFIQIYMICSYVPAIIGVTMDYTMEEKDECMLYTSGLCCILVASCIYSLHNLWPNIQACVSRVRTA